jgi:hypothetical protein
VIHRAKTCVALVALTSLATLAAPAQAQWGVWGADSLLAAGRVTAAESLYYAASSASPRDPGARAALGRYLAARGALRIGAVLLEEARVFGGDTASLARALVPVYRALGDYRALAALPKSPLSPPEQDRAEWLVTHPQTLEIEDSVAVMTYRPVGDGTGVGVVSIHLGERTIDALIDPRVSGLVLRGAAARRGGDLRVFGNDANGGVAVAPVLRIGGVTLANVAARIDTGAAPTGQRNAVTARLGLDVLRRLAPTFDPRSSTLILRRSGQIAQTSPGTRSAMLLDETGMRLLVRGRWESTTAHAAALLLGTQRWSFDGRRGEVLFQ